MPLVSIIVPVHNVEKTVTKCISSVLNQTYKDFELILLDDGSTDASGRICDGFAGEDPRIRVLHKENSGVSDTRNRGLSMARGEYVQFVDSDDWITPDATGLFVRAVTEHPCDMVIADFYRVVGERVSRKGNIGEEGMLDRAGYALAMMQKPADFYYGVLWNKFYRRSIISEHGLQMDCSINWCEDFLFNLEYLRHVHSVYALNVPLYYYVKRKGSLVSQGISVKKTIQMKRMVFAQYNNFYMDVFDDEDYEKRKSRVYRFLFDAASDGSVSPLSTSGNHRLGDERTSVSEGVQEGEGIFFDIYRERKLQEKLFDIVALRNELTTVDVKLLYYLSQPHENCTFQEMASVLNISGRKLSMTIQKLLAKEMIVPLERERNRAEAGSRTKEKQTEEKRKAGVREYMVTQEAESILSEMMFALCDIAQIEYEGFLPEEIEMYEKLDERRKQNIRRALR